MIDDTREIRTHRAPPRLLDAFSGAGGAAMGYHRAGFTVVGVDHRPQPRYPFEHHVGDALAFIAEHGHEYDVIHASPPCHDHSVTSSRSGMDGSGWLLDASREALIATGLPYVIENVEGARDAMPGAALICGGALSLGAWLDDSWMPLRRHRLFESNVFLMTPGCGCSSKLKVGVYGGGTCRSRKTGVGVNKPTMVDAMGIDWMTRAEMSQAIPPAFTAYVGTQIMSALTERSAA